MSQVEKSGTGLTRADWVPVDKMLPAQAQPVLIAYQFFDDDYLTVDMAERDGDKWLYLGGGVIDCGTVHCWAFPPEAPAVAGLDNGAQPARHIELAA